ncbi:hypothetical protein ABPG72_009442 [Tetrahymena utriculariae]
MKKINYKSVSQEQQINSKDLLDDGGSPNRQIIKQGDSNQNELKQNLNTFPQQIRESDLVWQQAQKGNIFQNTQGEEDDSLFIQTQRQNNQQLIFDMKNEASKIQKSSPPSKRSNKSHSMSIKSKHKEDSDNQNEQNLLVQNFFAEQTPPVNKNKLQDQLSNFTNKIETQSKQFKKRNGTMLISTQQKDDDKNVISPFDEEQKQLNLNTKKVLKQPSIQQGSSKILQRNGKSFVNQLSIKNNRNFQRVFASNIYSNQINSSEISDILETQQVSSRKWSFINGYLKLLKVKNKFLDLINHKQITDVERRFVMDQSDGFYSTQKKQTQTKSLLNRILTFTFHPAQALTLSIKIGMLLVTFYNLLFVPLIVGFQLNMDSSIVLIQQISGIFYFFEIFLNFRIPIYVKGEIQMDLWVIAKDYLNFNFLLDLVSVVGCALGTINTYFTLFTLVRITNLFTYTNYVNNHFYFAERFYKTWTLTRLIIFIIFMAHIFACIFHYIGLQHLNDDHFKSWLLNYNIQSEIWQVRYNYSLYYSFITMITIGYGDIAPQNSHERIACIAFALTSSIIFSFSINTIGNIFQDYFTKFQHQLQMRYNAIKFLRSRQVDKNLQLRILKYIEYIHEIERESPEKGLQIMNQVSEELKTEVFQDYYGNILQQNKYFSLNYSKQSILKLSLHVKEKMFAPGEILFEQGDQDGRLYYIIKGECEFYLKSREGSKNFLQLNLFQQTNQQFFGYKGFISGIPRELSCRSKNVSHVFYIQREDLINILKQDPQDYEKFCKIKDQFLFYTNSLGELCFACKNFGHTLTQCNRIHYVKNRSLLIQKYNFSEHQKRLPHKRKKNKYKSMLEINNVNIQVLNYKKMLIIDVVKEEINGQIEEQYLQYLQQEPIEKVQEFFPYLEFQEEGIILKNQSDQVDSESDLYTESDQSNSDTGEENDQKKYMNSIQEMIEDNLSHQNIKNNTDKLQKNKQQKLFKNEQKESKYNSLSKQKSFSNLNKLSQRNIQDQKLNAIQNRKEEDSKSMSIQDDYCDKSNSDNLEKMQINKSIESINKEIVYNQKQELKASQLQFFEQDYIDLNEIVEDDFNSQQNKLLIISSDDNQITDQINNILNNDAKQSLDSSSSSIKDQQRIQIYYKQFKQQQSEKIISQEVNDNKLNKQANQLNVIKIKSKQTSQNQNQRLDEGVDLGGKYLHIKTSQKNKNKSSLKNCPQNHRLTKKDFSDITNQINNQGLAFISRFTSTKGLDLNPNEKRFSQIPLLSSINFNAKENLMVQKINSGLEMQNTYSGLQKISKQSNSQYAHSKFFSQRDQEQNNLSSMKNFKSFLDSSESIQDQDKNYKEKFSRQQDKQQPSKYFLQQKIINQLMDLYIFDFETLKEYKNYFPHNNASIVCKCLKKDHNNNLISQKKLNNKEFYRTCTKFNI